jgi:hypothetical protein
MKGIWPCKTFERWQRNHMCAIDLNEINLLHRLIEHWKAKMKGFADAED